MLKGKFVVLAVAAAALLSWQIMPAGVDSANSGVVNPCSSTATSAGGCVVACPQGDGTTLAAAGATISVTAKDNTGTPIQGIPAADFWLIGWNNGLCLCGGSGAINADAASDANGNATISGSIAAGGCDTGVQVVIQGTVIADPNDWNNPLCLPIVVVSPDYNCDLLVDLIDFSIFGPGYPSPPKVYDACLDYNCDGVIDLVDFSIFGNHYLHSC